MSTNRRTPLYDRHVALGARMVPFAGFDMPVSYTGIIEEHTAVRERAGIFDVSHMGEFFVTGPDTWRWLDSVVTNHCSKLPAGGVLYTVMCREDGTVVDDLLVSRLGDQRALVVVNAANIAKDFEHMNGMLSGDVALVDASDRFGLLAVQGPLSREILKRCPMLSAATAALDAIGYYRQFTIDGGDGEIIVSRTGYTGELGFEVFVAASRAPALWDEILATGEALPVGLAARDTLRFEPAFCLYGHELDDHTTPLEAGLQWVVKFKKGDFCGRDALVAQKERGLERRLVGLRLEGRNIARQGYEVEADAAVVGTVTSGTFAPTLRQSLALAYVGTDALERGARLGVRVRSRTIPAARVEIPFYPSRAARD